MNLNQFEQEIFDYAYYRIVACDTTENVVELEIMEKYEISYEKCKKIIEMVIRQQNIEQAKKDILYGLLWCAGGSIATYVSYNKASSGGTYIIWWGAILFGGIQSLKGVYHFIKNYTR